VRLASSAAPSYSLRPRPRGLNCAAAERWTERVLVRERWRGLIHPALLAWAYFAFVHAATVGADRYHFPSIPFIAILAGIAIARFARVESVDKPALNPKTL
jgi:hypothetical protein